MILKHPQGNWCWAELLAGDTRIAKSFYMTLFGWTYRDDPIGDGLFYSMLFQNELEVGALYQLREGQIAHGTNPHWLGYICVDNVDATVAKAQTLGAKIFVEGIDVGDAGRMAYLEDLEGAPFCLWQPQDHIGIKSTDFGRPSFFELVCKDGEKSATFYTELFNWSTHKHDGPNENGYIGFQNNEEEIGGIVQMNESWGDIKPHWMVYFSVEEIAPFLEQAEELGAGIMTPCSPMGNGKHFAVIQDPQGAIFSIIQ